MSRKMHVSLLAMAASVALLTLAHCTQAQNLFESDRGSGHLFMFTPDGSKSTFASQGNRI